MLTNQKLVDSSIDVKYVPEKQRPIVKGDWQDLPDELIIDGVLAVNYLCRYYICQNGDVYSTYKWGNNRGQNQVPQYPRKLKRNYKSVSYLPRITFNDGGTKRVCRNLANLVASMFVPNTYGDKYVGYKDGNYLNVCADNLYWTNEKKQYNRKRKEF